MLNRIVLAIAIGVILSATGSGPAASCNRTAGCVMDSFEESYQMMRSGKMSEAMRAGQDNIEAFRRLREAEQAPAQGSNLTRRKR